MKYQKGFTLIEILVVVVVLTFIFAFGMTVDFSSFTFGTLQSEKSKVVSILERARSQAMANMFESPFGVCYISPDYIIFQGSTCTATGSELIPANVNIAENSGTIFLTVVFDQLSGNLLPPNGDINLIISDGAKTLPPITINNAGTINW